MYMIMRAVQILALVVFLWGSANDNAQNLVGNGAVSYTHLTAAPQDSRPLRHHTSRWLHRRIWNRWG